LQLPAAPLPRTLRSGAEKVIAESPKHRKLTLKQQVTSGANSPDISHRSWSAPALETRIFFRA